MSVRKSKSTSQVKIVTSFSTSPNIALVKYWGKVDESEVIPLNSSISLTLDCEDVRTISKLSLSAQYSEDIIIINGERQPINERIRKIFSFFRAERRHVVEDLLLPQTLQGQEKQQTVKDVVPFESLKFKLKSKNNFPTASGLASSSSGLGALALCLCSMFDCNESVSKIARLGSGSACRSVYGGLVLWQGPPQETVKKFYQQGQKLSPEDTTYLSDTCIAKQILPSSHFDDLRVIILCANFTPKEMPSTAGMQQSVQTSELLKYRALEVVENHISEVIHTLKNKDYNSAMRVVTRDSNQFHAVCLDTTPPIFYLSEFSRKAIAFVENFNRTSEKKIAYSFDAGTGFTLPTHQRSFNPRGAHLLTQLGVDSTQMEKAEYSGRPAQVIITSVGDGPKRLN